MPCFPNKMKRGDVEVRSNDPMIAVIWYDECSVTIMSAVHQHDVVIFTRHGQVVQVSC